ncbi:MAG: heme ABC transporter ATP-binding protein [Pseudomonadota bacterium]
MSLHVENLSVALSGTTILDDLSFRCEQGEFIAIVGENGAGKSTLMNCLAGALAFDGKITLHDRELHELSLATLAEYRAVLPQHSTLNFPLNVEEVVRLALSLSTLANAQQDTIIKQCLTMVDADQFAKRDYLSLSGGEKQRVQLARVLAQLKAYDKPEGQYLFLDEPTSALDLKHQYATLQMLRELCDQSLLGNLSVIVILHDLNITALYCDKVVLLNNGKLLAYDSPERVFQAETINQAFGVDVHIARHPDTNTPYLIPRVQS